MSHEASDTPLVLAQARAVAARRRFSATLTALQHRASPQVLAQDLAQSIKERGVSALVSVSDTAKRRPAAFGVALAAIGLFLARHRIARLLRRREPYAAPTLPSKSPQRGSSK